MPSIALSCRAFRSPHRAAGRNAASPGPSAPLAAPIFERSDRRAPRGHPGRPPAARSIRRWRRRRTAKPGRRRPHRRCRPARSAPWSSTTHRPVGELHRLLLVVGDEDRGVAGAGRGSRAASGASSRRTCASSAPNGSSSSSTRGSMASARASATRCRWPPDSCAGIALLQAGQLHQVEQLEHARLISASAGGWRAVAHLQAEADVLGHASCGGTARSAGTRKPTLRSLHASWCERVLAAEIDSALGRPLEPGDERCSSVVLPEPDGPSSAISSPERDVQRDVVQRRRKLRSELACRTVVTSARASAQCR